MGSSYATMNFHRTASIYTINARLNGLSLPRTPRVTIDIDPFSTFF